MSDPTPPPLLDVQDPLPESNWFWRRVFCFLVVGALLFFIYGSVDRLGKVAVLSPEKGIPALVTVTKSILFLAMLTITYYLLAPSAEQLTKLVKTASLLKSGVQIASRAIHRPGKTETATTIGLPPAPLTPPVETGGTPEPGEAASTADGAPDKDSGPIDINSIPPAGGEVTSEGGKA